MLSTRHALSWLTDDPFPLHHWPPHKDIPSIIRKLHYITLQTVNWSSPAFRELIPWCAVHPLLLIKGQSMGLVILSETQFNGHCFMLPSFNIRSIIINKFYNLSTLQACSQSDYKYICNPIPNTVSQLKFDLSMIHSTHGCLFQIYINKKQTNKKRQKIH